MKRILYAVLALIPVLCCCACGGNEILPVLRGISFDAGISYCNETYDCSVIINDEGVLMMTVNDPEDLSGLTLTFNDESVTAEYMGLTYTPKTGSMPVGNVSQTLYGVLRDIETNTETAVDNGENGKIKGKYKNSEYVFICSPSGLPISISIPEYGFEISFRNVTVS